MNKNVYYIEYLLFNLVNMTNELFLYLHNKHIYLNHKLKYKITV